MIHLLHSINFDKVRERSHEIEGDLLDKESNTSISRFNADNFNEAEITELIHSQGLFGQKYLVILDRMFENIEAKEFILKSLKEMAETDHVFLMLFGKLDKSILTRIEKKAGKTENLSEGKKEAKSEKFNVFSLADALGQRDRKKLWILYQTARDKGVPEELHGILWWQVKSMLLAKEAGSAKEADLNPFVYFKAKSAAKNYSEEELNSLSSSLISMYHDAHRGMFEFEGALERFILAI